ncbi:MAG: D-glycero-beta-D-manno-heptose-7-phosphate kinase [Nitrospira sp.]|nr:D-glycero-beta-D-manno-heptose-7-phosphate kinase [Nitrospira sp.]MDH4235703.1 D-glycero-beta-D-manno-heptose-7-phosphate kinase [Nitrospira sp.]MDH4327038.1 D-glycero-beta-D-manno-heptose-7-phosphate kinase [Nitrospira sp.]MDH5251792.1 D-glycero-beta-D-manno-heptose-7-phosphate kinase [Nitrospira sp.]MDH5624716.1 D-glycero-beta-D-manno-heptose-7-phosphate kinase [Nitrospira sp.]
MKAGAKSSSAAGEPNSRNQSPTPQALRQYIQRFPQASVLVVGDLILDHYVMGRVSRISPEAPVPVVHVESESLRLGGAANVFNNILALGGKVDLCGVIGADESGRLLMKELGTKRSGRGGVVIDHDRPTTRKSRVIAHNQQIVRYDIEGRTELKASLQRRIVQYVESRLRELSCVVVSDYAKGVVSASLMSDITRLAALRKVPVIVDPKVEHFGYYKGVTVMTPNHLEATQASGLHGDDDQTINEAGAMIRQRLGCQSVLITRGEKGMSLYERDGVSWHLPTQARQVYDVTGAGDTVIGTLALALSTGASIKQGAILANHAAGIVVGMVGTATVSPKQLMEALGNE